MFVITLGELGEVCDCALVRGGEGVPLGVFDGATDVFLAGVA